MAITASMSENIKPIFNITNDDESVGKIMT